MAKKTLLDDIIESIKGIDGRLINQSGTTKQMISDLNYKVVAPARAAADSAVSAADAAVASAQSDVSKAFTQIADTANALSDAKTAFGSDVAAAKKLANTAQTTANSAIKSAASAASDLTAVASQAKSNASGITKVTSDVGLLQTTVADNSGNISKVQETATKIQQAVSSNSGAIMVANQTADSAVTVASDARSNATVAIQTASQASITASSASGQAASAVLTANGVMTTASDAKSDATVAIQTASGASQTATNAQSDATIAKQTASEAIVQASNAKSDFAQLSIRANKIEANVATNSGAIASVQQTADGIQTQVYNSDGSSKITQLSGLIAAKVSQGDYNSQITQLKNDINQRVQVGDVISQINQEAGGDTLIQVSNGKGSLILDAGNTIITGKAWIPSASIANLTADQIQAGTLSGSKVHAGDNSGNGIDMGVLSDNYVGLKAYANNGDHTDIDLNGIHNYGANYDTRIQQGKVTTDYLAVNGGGMIDFRDSNGTGMIAEGSKLTFDVYNSPAGYLTYSGVPLADWPSGSGGNELKIMYGESLAIAANSDTNSRALFSTVNTQIGYQQAGSTSPDVNLTGLRVNNSDRYVRLGTWNSNSTWSRAEFGSDGVNINSAGLSLGLKDNVIHMYMDGNYSATAMQLTVDGWAWINGYCEAMGHTQHSTLSTKTRIEEADPDHMLDLVNNTELTTFAYKSELAGGTDHRHIGPIIDDVNDVAQYQIPSEFVAPTKTARDDDNMIGALFGAVQALTKRIKKLEDKA